MVSQLNFLPEQPQSADQNNQNKKYPFRERYFNLLKKYRRTKHAVTGLLVVVFILGIIIGSMSIYYFGLIAQAKEDVYIAYNLWKDDHFLQSKESALQARKSLGKIQGLLDHKFLFSIPLIGGKLEAGNRVVNPSISALDSYASLVDIVKELQAFGAASYDNLADKQGAVALVGNLLKEVDNIYKESKAVLAVTEEAGISDWPTIKKAAEEFKRFEDEDAQVAGIVYPVLEKEGMTYLLLMQNNRKLMPTGGYIGNFGILKIKDGEIVDFYLKDTPEFDRENKSGFKINPPEPLRDYYGKDQWTLTDVNWSPSFPLTAQRAQALYKAQGGQEEPDGVIAFSPEVVNGWLDLVGGVAVDNIEYNSGNFGNTPQYVKECKENKVCERTELAGGKTIEGSDRKYIINPIAQEVRKKLFKMPLLNILGAMTVISKNVEEQKMFVYFNDPELQAHVAESGFSGDLLPAEKDYLMVVDANLSTARLDQYISRKIDYTVAEVNGKIEAALLLTYNYSEDARKDDPLVPAYRDYLRVYAPNGAKLIAGGQKFDVASELGRTAFGTFISLPPGQEKKLEFKYELPARVKLGNEYKLVLQKQLGNEYTDFNINVTSANRIKEYLPLNCSYCPDEQTNQVVWQGKLSEDREFTVRNEFYQ
ncbi:hypothetical protein COT99_03305 [Candidatus Falkowbacteria bacterium CG10_big_fil_rev_8_21_14_0_10_43_10]|uniref:DUF4012 domain-containing protein n=1 Tax=Candidatus Falkowbacteria bacterium CG10_big_fil_rev_8_21_14_0_10_43_10 TaxID=1974567 RepID=A0A2H0V1Q9_9BACT|nr:MAG: hypothetical protein COT99_03305 [Candidatus Falkowbacteria bacterium CG10_big_fil_rev_8_21_14_0_10_43_10]